jgi:CheY-like chemotaxis protein
MKVLVADDNPVTRELIREILDATDYELIEAVNGKEAIEKIEQARPDLVILDIQMPVLDGYAVLRKLRKDPRFNTMRVAALTAYAMSGDRQKALSAGFDDYITKPIHADTFRNRVDELLWR